MALSWEVWVMADDNTANAPIMIELRGTSAAVSLANAIKIRDALSRAIRIERERLAKRPAKETP